jgi:hypothetical protein
LDNTELPRPIAQPKSAKEIIEFFSDSPEEELDDPVTTDRGSKKSVPLKPPRPPDVSNIKVIDKSAVKAD